jgi:hypothetical protein
VKRFPVLLALLATVASLGIAATAAAHGRSVSYSTWDLDADGARVRARISRLELTRLALDPVASQQQSDRVGRLLAAQLQMFAAGRRCEPAGAPTPLAASPGQVVYAWRLECPGAGPRSIRSELLLGAAPSHLHFARVTREGSSVERVLTQAEPTWELFDAATERPSRGTSFVDYLGIGVRHILSGWDHLAFVLALLLLAVTVREVVALVTGFTVAHSITLGLAVLGVVRPEIRVVEALIGFSIALVAAENTWLLAGRGRAIPLLVTSSLVTLAVLNVSALPRLAAAGLALFAACHFAMLRASSRPARLRAAVAFAFGLIHGFGFAGVLAEMSLPAERLVPALVGFNLGVEAGQLVVVVVAWPLLRLIARQFGAPAERLVVEFGSAVICGLGTFWFVTRAFG